MGFQTFLISKGVESMGKVKWILVCGVLMAALSVNVAAEGPKSDMGVFFAAHSTPAFSAVLGALMGQQSAGEELDTALSVSNTCAAPALGMVPADAHLNFQECGVESTGPVWLFCYDQGGTSWTFNSSTDLIDDMPIGGGLDEDGMLPPGGTFTVYMSNIVEAVTGDSANVSFAGYCFVVGQDFEAIAGTYVNFIPLAGIQQDFALQSDFKGVGIFTDGM
jgi:hypothetical protein